MHKITLGNQTKSKSGKLKLGELKIRNTEYDERFFFSRSSLQIHSSSKIIYFNDYICIFSIFQKLVMAKKAKNKSPEATDCAAKKPKLTEKTEQLETEQPETEQPETEQPELDATSELYAGLTSCNKLQQQHLQLETDLEQEIENLKQTYHAKFDKIYKERKEAVSTKIPGFWLKVLKSTVTASLIEPCDEELLKHCVDITKQYLHDGFCLKFEFSENKFIKNKFLQKRFIYQKNPKKPEDLTEEEVETGGLLTYERLDQLETTSGKIDWETNFTMVDDKPIESFFFFFQNDEREFASIRMSEEKYGVNLKKEEIDTLRGALTNADFQIGEQIRDELIPNAVFFYMGSMGEDEEEVEGDEESCGKDVCKTGCC